MASLSEGWAKLNSPVNIRDFNRNLFILVRSKAATSLVNMLYYVNTLDLRSPSPVRVRGCRLVRCTPKAINSSTRNVQRTSESAPGSGVAFRAA